jgi:hypothetical protein
MTHRHFSLPPSLPEGATERAPVLSIYVTEKKQSGRSRPFPKVRVELIREMQSRFQALDETIRNIDKDLLIPRTFYNGLTCIKIALCNLRSGAVHSEGYTREHPMKVLVRVRDEIDVAAEVLRDAYGSCLQKGGISRAEIQKIDDKLNACLIVLSPFPPGPRVVGAELSIWDLSRLPRFFLSDRSSVVAFTAVLTLELSNSTNSHFDGSFLFNKPPPYVPLEARCVPSAIHSSFTEALKLRANIESVEDEVGSDIAPTVYGVCTPLPRLLTGPPSSRNSETLQQILTRVAETISTVVPYDFLA